MKTIFLTKKKLILAFAIFMALLLFGVLGFTRGAIQTAAQTKLLPIYCVQSEKKQVALT